MEIRHLRNAVSRDLERARSCEFLLSSYSASISTCCADVVRPASLPRLFHRFQRAITDLAAHQAGDGVQLIFTLPSKTAAGDRLALPPAVEIVRGTSKPDGSPDIKSMRVVYTIPGSLVTNYIAEGHVKFVDPVAPAETRAHPGGTLVYVMRTRASQKRASGDSNAVFVRMYPVPAAYHEFGDACHRARD